MSQSILLLLLGFFVIVLAADYLVSSAAHLARRHGISTSLIGLTIIAFGTSTPEIVVSLISALKDNANIGIGNAIGSNIANIGLVLGITALITPIKLPAQLLKQEAPLLFAIMMGTYLLLKDGNLNRIDSMVLLVLLVAFLVYLTLIKAKVALPVGTGQHTSGSLSQRWPILILIVSLIALQLSARLIVTQSIWIAQTCGVSELVIGLTIVAIGTSLPEVITSVVSAIKGDADLAFGNIIGSNIFNLLAVLPVNGIIAPTKIDPTIVGYDLPIMFVFTLLMLILSLRQSPRLTRLGGGILLLMYIVYLVTLL